MCNVYVYPWIYLDIDIYTSSLVVTSEDSAP